MLPNRPPLPPTRLDTVPATDAPAPTDAPIDDATGLPLQQYSLIPGTYYESPDAVSADPSAISTDGPFPLVV